MQKNSVGIRNLNKHHEMGEAPLHFFFTVSMKCMVHCHVIFLRAMHSPWTKSEEGLFHNLRKWETKDRDAVLAEVGRMHPKMK